MGRLHRWALGLVACVALGACGAPPPVKVTDTVERARRLDRVTAFLQGLVDAGRVAGAAAQITLGGETVYREAVGGTGHGDATLTPDHIFALYSMSKPITTVAALMLYEEGHFVLDDPVAKYLPEFEGVKVGYWPTGVNQEPERILLRDPRRPIKIIDLLTHTSGLAYAFTAPNGLRPAWKAVWKGPKTLAELVRKIATTPLVHDPGDGWTYGVSTDVVGRLVEVISGVPFETFLERRIFEPLGMKDTGFVPGDLARLVPLGMVDEVTGKLVDGAAPGGDRIREERAQLQRLTSLRSGGGGLYSTLADYGRFLRALLGGGALDGVRLLSPVTVRYMVTNHLPETMRVDDGFGFGLGVRVIESVGPQGDLASAGSYSWAGAACTYFLVAPAYEMTAILLAQRRPFSFRMEREFHRTALQTVTD